MSTVTRGTGDFNNRDQIIIDGFLKHRETGLVTRWRHRYVVFKIASAGRLAFTIYKDQPAIPSNELSEVPIEDYGGLDTKLKLDGEKHVFAIITTNSTECFAADNPQTLKDWSNSMIDYLGKELVLSISVPYKQNMLRPGKGHIRVRNSGFTITNAEVPPKCQGSWQILHIRKFGGNELFRFETGSKCPSGEFLYVINTEDNEKMKSVFTDLSLHKPIFKDDRMGRRMTQEHEILKQIRTQIDTHRSLGTRRSLQSHDMGSAHYVNQSSMTTPRRTSVQHEPFLNRPRSNAVINEQEIAMNDDNRYYYNLHDIGMGGGLLPTATNKRANSDPPPEEHIYYNQLMVNDLQSTKQKSNQRRRRLSSDDDSEDDDFVNVHDVIDVVPPSANPDDSSLYYNLQDSLSKEPSTHQVNYENFVLPHQTRSDSPGDQHVYTNVAIPHTKSRDSPVVQITSISSSPNNASATPPEGDGCHSDSDSSTASLRNRTTSIVDNQIVSIEHVTRSCDDVSKISPENSLISTNSQNHSDTEIEVQLIRRESLGSNPSKGENKLRPPAYDHLQPKSPSEKARLVRREHTYEDVDLPLSESLDNSTETNPYNRKIEILGHGHSYEYVQLVVKNNGQNHSSPKRSPLAIPSPRTLNGSFEEGTEGVVKEGVESSPRHGRKPIPAPRKMTKNHSVDEIMQARDENHLVPDHAHDHTHRSPQCSPSHAPAIPPKGIKPGNQYKSHLLYGGTTRSASSHDIFASHRKPAIPPKFALNSANYVPVEVTSTQSLDFKKNTTVNYTDINHFLTRQIQTMREERELEKGLV